MASTVTMNLDTLIDFTVEAVEGDSISSFSGRIPFHYGAMIGLLKRRPVEYRVIFEGMKRVYPAVRNRRKSFQNIWELLFSTAFTKLASTRGGVDLITGFLDEALINNDKNPFSFYGKMAPFSADEHNHRDDLDIFFSLKFESRIKAKIVEELSRLEAVLVGGRNEMKDASIDLLVLIHQYSLLNYNTKSDDKRDGIEIEIEIIHLAYSNPEVVVPLLKDVFASEGLVSFTRLHKILVSNFHEIDPGIYRSLQIDLQYDDCDGNSCSGSGECEFKKSFSIMKKMFWESVSQGADPYFDFLRRIVLNTSDRDSMRLFMCLYISLQRYCITSEASNGENTEFWGPLFYNALSIFVGAFPGVFEAKWLIQTGNLMIRIQSIVLGLIERADRGAYIRKARLAIHYDQYYYMDALLKHLYGFRLSDSDVVSLLKYALEQGRPRISVLIYVTCVNSVGMENLAEVFVLAGRCGGNFFLKSTYSAIKRAPNWNSIVRKAIQEAISAKNIKTFVLLMSILGRRVALSDNSIDFGVIVRDLIELKYPERIIIEYFRAFKWGLNLQAVQMIFIEGCRVGLIEFVRTVVALTPAGIIYDGIKERAAMEAANNGQNEVLTWLIYKIRDFTDLASILDAVLSGASKRDGFKGLELTRLLVRKYSPKHPDIQEIVSQVALNRIDPAFLRQAVDEFNFRPSGQFKSLWLASLMEKMILCGSLEPFDEFYNLFRDWRFENGEISSALKRIQKYRNGHKRRAYEAVKKFVRQKLSGNK